ncbi:TIGR01841 family phasin [Alcaligenaceae bacterium]|nr:TIGR01841 family phasin [Alcaligenaceae bacterium]
MSKNTADGSGAAGANPFADLTRMFDQFKVPGMDMAALTQARQQDIAALVQANQAVYEGMQALANKQAEMLRQAVQDIQGVAAGGVDTTKQTELIRKAYEKTLSDMTELAEIARKSQADAMASISQRATQHMAEMKKMMQPK